MLLKLPKDKWEEAAEHAKRAVVPDNHMRACELPLITAIYSLRTLSFHWVGCSGFGLCRSLWFMCHCQRMSERLVNMAWLDAAHMSVGQAVYGDAVMSRLMYHAAQAAQGQVGGGSGARQARSGARQPHARM
jgi:hypothetical protein